MATSLARLSTPSPPGRAKTPPTPKHGYSDNWDQFSPRKSARLSSQRISASAARTPSPTPASSSRSRNQHRQQLRSPPSGNSPISPIGSPRKKKMPPMNSNRRASGHLTMESAASAAASLGLSAKAKGKTVARGGSTNIATQTGMLPTPAKTPARKQSSAENEANIAAIARNLFHTETEAPQVYSTPQKKRGKKYTGITMDSFKVVEEDEAIQIFTDSQDRIPVEDHSIDNPFFGKGASLAQPDPPKRRSKRNQVTVPGERRQHIEDLAHREDGLVYVFRGKKIFRKFEDTPNEIDEAQAEEGAATPSKRLTRSSIKPRLLFPVVAEEPATEEPVKDQQTLDDEEALTDIEVPEHESEDILETPLESGDEVPDTPAAPKYAPASPPTPPTTVQTRRLVNKLSDDETPIKTRGGKRSLFADWRQSKQGESSSAAHKRPGSSLGSDVPAKRSRA